jgi:hypothetical protein
MSILQQFRRRRGLAVRLLAPVICAASLGVFVSPCVMAGALGETGATHHSGHCPFCPLSHDHDGSGIGQHMACSTLAGVVDQAPQVAVLKWDLSHAIPATEVTVPPAVPVVFDLARLDLDPGIHAPPIALNLRYCVFLN